MGLNSAFFVTRLYYPLCLCPTDCDICTLYMKSSIFTQDIAQWITSWSPELSVKMIPVIAAVHTILLHLGQWPQGCSSGVIQDVGLAPIKIDLASLKVRKSLSVTTLLVRGGVEWFCKHVAIFVCRPFSITFCNNMAYAIRYYTRW